MMDRSAAPSLRGQILTRTLVVVLVPLAALAVVAVLGLRTLGATGDQQVADSRQLLIAESVSGRLLSEAETAGREIELTVTERIGDVEAWANQPAVVEGAEVGALASEQQDLSELSDDQVDLALAPSGGLAVAPAAEDFLATELERLPLFRRVVFTDRNGFTVASVGGTDGLTNADQVWWQRAWDTGLHVGEVTSLSGTGTITEEAGTTSGAEGEGDSAGDVVPIAVRIDDERGQAAGVIRAFLDISFVADLADSRAGDGIEIAVVTGGRRLLAETATDHDPARLGAGNLSSDQLSMGIAEALTGEPGSAADDDTFHGFAPVEQTFEPNGSDGGSHTTWYVVASQPRAAALAPLDGLIRLNEDLGHAGRELIVVVAIVVGFAAMVGVFTALSLSRRIIDPIEALTRRADRVAHTELPDTVDQLRSGDDTGAGATGSEPVVAADSELQLLADACNSVQVTAVRLAAEQVEQRAETAETFANLGRRNQSLVKRQIGVIDELEEWEEDPDRLASLSKLSHLATRMRRNAENLLVMAGQRSTTRRAAPARLELVVREAVNETEARHRIALGRIEPAALVGQVVTDVSHLLAELFDNALAFSPPETPVVITGMSTRGRYVLSIVDRGIGLGEQELAVANDRLSAGAGLDTGSTRQLGLLVVAELAVRHGIRVRLQNAENGGTVALAELPESLLRPVEEAPPPAAGTASSAAPIPPEPPAPAEPSARPAPVTPEEQAPVESPVPAAPTLAAAGPPPAPAARPADAKSPPTIERPAPVVRAGKPPPPPPQHRRARSDPGPVVRRRSRRPPSPVPPESSEPRSKQATSD
jgi:signal transduction histidine kinase